MKQKTWRAIQNKQISCITLYAHHLLENMKTSVYKRLQLASLKYSKYYCRKCYVFLQQ